VRQRCCGDRFLLACRLVERIYETGHRSYIQVADPEEARHLDRLLQPGTAEPQPGGVPPYAGFATLFPGLNRVRRVSLARFARGGGR
jgi:hypothetical protein